MTHTHSTPKIKVRKRNGRLVPWDSSRIISAIAHAFYDVRHNGAPNPARGDRNRLYGLDPESFTQVKKIAEKTAAVFHNPPKPTPPSVEQIQDAIEKALADSGEWEIARSFILYREQKTSLRIRNYSENGLSEFIATAKYARYRHDLNRRETFSEVIDRVEKMHLERVRHIALKPATLIPEHPESTSPAIGFVRSAFGNKSLTKATADAFSHVRKRNILPSMRSLQFGGKAIHAHNARMFNCAFSPIDRIEFFREFFYLLLAGCGCGFSVQKEHVNRLPSLPDRPPERDLPLLHHTISDSIEGWSDALHALFLSFLQNRKIEFNFSKIRPRGTPMKTSGGRAPGHLPLKKALAKSEKILRGAAGRKLRPIEAYDICMFVARSVIAGGTRRSATIALFSPDDSEMMSAKTGNWMTENPQRSASNNSAVLNRNSTDRQLFHRLFQIQKEFGEPGFYFTSDNEYGSNPCVEIGLNPVIKTPLPPESEKRLRQLGYNGPLPPESRLSGWQMCNLCTINAAHMKSESDFYTACHNAALIGTLQAAWIDIPYLGPVTRFLNERESLIGISICGILDNPALFLSETILKTGAEICRISNAATASAIGIPPAARTTCVKPEGTTSLLLKSGSGIHPHHAKHYFRRIQVSRNDAVYQHFKKSNPHMTEPSIHQPETDDVITFPETAPDGALLRNDLSAADFLSHVLFVQKHWVENGRASESISPGLHHNVSNTCTVRPHEWDSTEQFIWENRNHFTGIALLPFSADKLYPQAPREEITTADDIAKWNRLVYQKVDYTTLTEESDETSLQFIAACAGGACEV